MNAKSHLAFSQGDAQSCQNLRWMPFIGNFYRIKSVRVSLFQAGLLDLEKPALPEAKT